jgi:hypothetical protein
MPYKNKAVKAAYAKLWYQNNKDRSRNSKRVWRKMRGEHFLHSERKHNKERARKIRLLALQRYGNLCKCCGETITEFLTFDHINADGAAERRAIGRVQLMWKLAYGPLRSDIQILCANCNSSLGFYGFCPHNPTVHRPIIRNGRPCKNAT